MAAQGLRQPFTAEEQKLYGSIFTSLDVENLGIVTGEASRSIFEKSGLPPAVLGEIWQLADPTNLGFLNQFAFFVALRLVGHVQSGSKPDISLTEVAGPLAKLNGNSQQPTLNTHTPASSISSQQIPTLGAQASAALPPLSNHDISKFNQLFIKSAPSGVISGDKARDIFLKAKLPTPVLGQIWSLVDRNNIGQLNRDEFVVAMFLIQGNLNGTIKQLPASIPPQVWDQVKHFQTQAPTGSTITSPQSPQPVLARPTGSRVPSSFGNASNDWTISAQKRAQFDSTFEALDKNSQGVLGPNEVAPFLMTSKLPQDVLATIWDLADIHNTGEFTKDEFAIAMFLVQKKVAGVELPHVIPESLLPHNHQVKPVAQSAFSTVQEEKSIPQIPSRDTKPKSSLNDLVDLNDAFSTPSPSIPDNSQRNTSNSTVNYTPTGSKAFVPTSSFGQVLAEQHKVAETPTFTSPPQEEPRAFETKPEPAFTFQQTGSLPKAQSPSISTPSYIAPPASAQTSTTTGSIFQPLQSTASDFQSRGLQLPQNNDLLADSNPEVSGQLSQATTDLANLSNQIGSLTNQTSQLHEKRTRAEKELAKITSLKNDIQNKLANLRAAYQQEVKQTKEVEGLFAVSKKETEDLRKETSVAEAQYNQVQANLQSIQAELEESQKENVSLKERLGILNAEYIEATKQLEKVQHEARQSKGLVAINSKQLGVSELKSTGIKEEITALLTSIKELDGHHDTYLQKQNQITEFQRSIESNEQALLSRKTQFEQYEAQFKLKEEELKNRLESQKKNEQVVQDEEQRIQKEYANLQDRQNQLHTLEAQLQQQQVEYAQRVQQFSYKQIEDATSGTHHAPIEDSSLPSSKDLNETVNTTESKSVETDESEAPKTEDSQQSNKGLIGTAVGIVAGSIGATAVAATSTIAGNDSEKGDTEFSSPLAPTTEQTTSVNSEDYPYRANNQFTHLDIERPQSTTSSVQNNAPQSVRGDDIEVDENASDNAVANEANEQPALASDVLREDYNSNSLKQTESSGAGSFEIVDGHNESESELTLKSHAGAIDETTREPNADEVEASIPGAWNVEQSSRLVEASNSLGAKETEPLPEVDQTRPVPTESDSTFTVSNTNDDEFPPIKELEINESDSDDELFHETVDNLPTSPAKNKRSSLPDHVPGTAADLSASRALGGNAEQSVAALDDHIVSGSTGGVAAAGIAGTLSGANVKNSGFDFESNTPQNNFKDEFSDLEEAKVETGKDEFDEFDGLEAAQEEGFDSFNEDEFTSGNNFNDELEGSTFFGANDNGSQLQSPTLEHPEGHEHDNQEWEQIFAGFGNQPPAFSGSNDGTPTGHQQSIAQPVPTTHHETPVSPPRARIATTPRSLAVQELTGMGFSKEEALAALEKEKWNLEAATNYLLDSA